MDNTTNYYTNKRVISRDKLPQLKDVPTPNIVILDLLPVLAEYKDLIHNVDEFEVSLEEIITNVIPYLIEDDKADAGLADFVANSYDIFLAAAEKKREGRAAQSVYEEIEISQQAYNTSMATELVGMHLLEMMRTYGLYYKNCAYYQFEKMEDKFSPRLIKSDVYFFPF